MKKVLVGFAAAALAAVMCASFVACGEKLDDVSDAEKIVSDEVTAEEWTAAFAEENFENGQCKYVTIKETETKEEGAWGKSIITNTSKFDGANQYYEATIKAEGIFSDEKVEEVGYLAQEEGLLISYHRTGAGTWWKEKIPMPTTSSAGDGYVNVVYEVKEKYHLFTYSEEAKGYVLKDGAEWKYGATRVDGTSRVHITLADIVIKFTDGKISAYIFGGKGQDEKGNDNGVCYQYEYSFTYGGQKVSLPIAV